ncbi:MAG TPA: hypothetical protein VFV50_06510 [Bdellovibrionales bacterium]|nr:hypothetical protein [Bdellovibrionales bacterium]
MKRGLTAVLGLLTVCFFAFLSHRAIRQSEAKDKLSAACVYGVIETHRQTAKTSALRFGPAHDHVTRSLAGFDRAQKSGELDESSFVSQASSMLLAHVPAAVRTCMKVMAPTFNSCLENATAPECVQKAAASYSHALLFTDRIAKASATVVDMARLTPDMIISALRDRKGDERP